MSTRRKEPAGALHFVAALVLDRPPTDDADGSALARLLVWLHQQGARHVTVANAGTADHETPAMASAGSFPLPSGRARHFAGDGFGLTLLPSGAGRAAIVEAVRRLKGEGRSANDLGAEIEKLAGPEPDLILTFAGRKSLDDAFVWQAGYAEFVHLDAPWEKATPADLEAALAEFRRRKRRFGDVPTPAAT